MQTETKAADATVKKATTATEKKTTGLKQTASKTETNKKADAPKKRGRKPGSKNKPKSGLLLKFIYSIVEKKQTRMLL